METRERILRVTADLIERGGGPLPTTRAICAAAGVTPPTLYHHFHDKQTIILTAASERLSETLNAAGAASGSDPVEGLRHWWSIILDFAEERPRLFQAAIRISGGTVAECLPAAESRLRGHVLAVQEAGLLRVDSELAMQVLWSGVLGVALTCGLAGLAPHAGLGIAVREPLIESLIIRVAHPAKPARRPFSRRR